MDAHYRTTGPEIWEQTAGKVDGFICSCGTGGTIAGTSKFLKEKRSEREIKCLLASPVGSGVVAEKLTDGGWKNRLKTAEEKFVHRCDISRYYLL
jgi:cysteine synthase